MGAPGPRARPRPRPHHCPPLALLLLLLQPVEVPALRDVQVTVPQAAAAGDTVMLSCSYNLESDVLYSVKWYRGRQEFFRYIPKELPHTRVFPLEGINVDLDRSNVATVYLRGVQPPLSGRYRCEVSADAPSFHTAMKTSYMHVVELPDTAPEVVSEKQRVAPGDRVDVRCVAPSTYPPANLTWMINGKLVKGTPISPDALLSKPTSYPQNADTSLYSLLFKNRSRDNSEQSLDRDIHSFENRFNYNRRELTGTYKSQGLGDNRQGGFDNREYDASQSGEQLNKNLPDFQKVRQLISKAENMTKQRSASSLVFTVSQDSFQLGQLNISCRASVFNLYSARSDLIMDEDKPQLAPILGNSQTHNGAGRVSGAFLVIMVLHLAAS